MNKNEVQAWFSQIRKEQYEIIHLRQMIKTAKFGLLPSGIAYDKDKVQTSPDDTMSKVMARALDMQKELETSIAILQERQIKAEQYIQTLEDSSEREVMRYYYLDTEDGKPLTFEQVGIRMNFYIRHVQRLHNKAIEELANKTIQAKENALNGANMNE
jgi:23S rRNA G2069 N7-methylase RlmK/C1962 C5-methylase RlmI